MEDLIAWLRAQLDEDERLARQAFADHNDAGPDWHEQWSGALNIGDGEDLVITNDSQVSRFMEAFDPARVLAEVEAKRRILAHIGMVVISPGREALPAEYVAQMEIFARELAQPYAGRPGWREEWRDAPHR
jgi:hypothetical protein